MRTPRAHRVRIVSALCMAVALATSVPASPSSSNSEEVVVAGSNGTRQVSGQLETNATIPSIGDVNPPVTPGPTARTSKLGEADQRSNSSLPASPQAAGDRMPSSHKEMTGLFFEGVVAIFAVLSLVFSILVAWFAAKGWSVFREVKGQLHAEVKKELIASLTAEIAQEAHAELRRQVHAEIEQELRQSLETTKQELRKELQKMAKEPEWQESFAKEMQARVERLLHPPSAEVTSNEFDAPETKA